MSETTPLWQDEFATLDLVTPTHTNGTWAAGMDNPKSMVGAKDAAGKSFDANPNQTINGVGVLNPFKVGPVTDSAGKTLQALTCELNPSTAAEETAIDFANWGCFLQTNADVISFKTPFYIEFEALFDGVASNIWPAIWLFAAEGYNSGHPNSVVYAEAELDLLEYCNPQGYTTCWTYASGQKRTQDGWDTPYGDVGDVWHVYGVEFTDTTITFYKDGVQTAQINPTETYGGPDGMPEYYAGAELGFRFDYTTTSNVAIPAPVSFSVAYVKQWESFAASQGTTPPAELEVTTKGFHNGVVGEAYVGKATATGGKEPYTWSATGLPAGLTMNAAGEVTGTPESQWPIVVTVKDSSEPAQTATAVVSTLVKDA